MTVDPATPGAAAQNDIAGRVNLGTNGAYLRFNHMIGNGVGWSDGGFTTLGGWIPFSEYGSDNLWYSDLRIFVTNDGQVGQNVGLGARHYNENMDRFFGGAIFFDNDHGARAQHFRQFTGSLETLGNGWDARVNGYIPFGDDLRSLCDANISPDPFFQGNRIYFPGTAMFQQALTGGDAEIGAPLLPNAQWLRGYVGYYAYNATNHKDPQGFRGRLEAQLSDDVSAQAIVSNDHTFGTLVNGFIDIRLGGGRPNRTFANLTTRERMYLPVNRNWRIATDVFKDTIKVVARDVNDHHKLTVVWVDDTSGSSDGTYENPYQTLAEAGAAPNADLILVRAGSGAGYTDSIVLKDNQRLLGEGREHFVDAYAAYCKTSITGNFALPDPGFTNTGNYPLLTGATGNAVTLADNNEVSAFTILSPTGNAIAGANINDFNINYVDIVTPGQGGIILTNASGTGLINNVTVDGALAEAILINNTNTAPLDLTIDNLPLITNNTLGLGLIANNSAITATVDGLLADSNAAGLDIRATAGGSITADFRDNTFTNSTSGDGIRLTALDPGSVVDVAMDNTTADGSFGNGLLVNSSNQGTVLAAITNGDFSNSGLDAVRVLADNSTGNVLTLEDTPGDNAGVDGLHVELTNGSVFDITVTNGSFIGAGDDAYDLLVDGSSTLNLTVDPTPSFLATDNGLVFNVINGSTANLNYADADFSFAGNNGILGNIGNGSTVNLTMLNSPVNNAGSDGMHVVASNSSTFNADITGGSFSNSGNDAIDLLLTTNSVAILNMTDTPGANNGSAGFRFDIESGSSLQASIAGGDFSNNGVNGINGTVNGASTSATIDLTDVNADGNGLDGFIFRVQNGAQLTATGTNVALSNSGNHAFRGILQNNAQATFAFDSLIATNSGADGLYLTGQNNSSFDASFADSSFAFSGQNVVSPNRNAVEVALDASAGTLVLDGTVGNNSGQNGMLLTAQNASVLAVTTLDGNFNDSPVNAIQANVTGAGSLISLSMTDTTGDNAGDDAIRFNVANSGAFMATATGGSFNNAGTNGIRGQLDNSAIASLNLTNVSVANAQEDGLLVNSTNLSQFTATTSGGSFANAGQDTLALNRNGIELNVNNSTNTLNMTGTNVSGAGADGLHYTVSNGGTLNGNITGGSFANAGSNAVEGSAIGTGATANVALNGTAASNAGSTGVLLNADAGSTHTFSFSNGSISNSGDHGIQVTANGLNTHATVNLTNATVDNNGQPSLFVRDGLNATVTAGALLDVNMFGGTINSNRNRGIFASIDGAGSTANFTSNGTQMSNNRRGDGFAFSVTAGGTLNGDFTGGTVSSNGLSGLGSGVNGTANGLGSSANVSFTGTLADNNSRDGFTMSSLNSGAVTLELHDGVSASNNTNYGVFMSADGPNSMATLLMTGNNTISLNGAGGVCLTATNGAIIDSTLSGNFSQNGGSGVTIMGSNSTLDNLVFSGQYSNNAGHGINIDLNNTTVNLLSVNNATINNNNGTGLRIVAVNGSSINNGSVTSSTISGNSADGLLFQLTDSSANLFSISNNLGITNNAGNGIHVLLDNSPTTDFAVVNNAGISDNGANGVLFDLTNSDLIDSVVSGNIIQRNLLAGVQYTLDDSNLSGSITDNTITDNTLSGVGITAADSVALTTIDFLNTAMNHFIEGNTINSNGSGGAGAGLLVDVGENVFFGGHIVGNTFTSNQSFGIGVTGTDSLLNLEIGSSLVADGNTFDQNSQAAIAVTLQDTTAGTVNIQNNTITRTAATQPLVNNNSPTFQGDGINIRLTSTSILTPSSASLVNSVISNNTIGNLVSGPLGNAGRGVVLSSDGNALISNLTMNNNVVANNAGDGIQFNKDANSNILGVEISNSRVNSNGGDGFEVVVANGNQTTTFNVHNNQFNNNVGRGIHLEEQADSRINLDLTQNVINSNGSHGIQLTESVNDPTDLRQLTGTWIQNQITNNVGSGISLNGAYGVTTALVIGQNGVDGFGNSLGNLIDNNQGNGIASTGVGSATISNNTISNNDLNGVDIDLAVANGTLQLNFDNNIIGTNTGDGMELRATSTAFLSVTATSNSIVNNGGRGVDLLNQVNATSWLAFGDGTLAGGNLIDNNGGEGFYVVNTSSANQTQNVSSDTPLLADGLTTVAPDVVLDLQYNDITNNGSPGNFSSAGLVLRVGTSNSAGFDLTGNGAAGVGNAGLAGNGRVNARVTNNLFGGNFGTDVLLESFVSTLPPLPTLGTWDNTQFLVTQFERDPLARLNMVFRDNIGESLDVTRGDFDKGVGDPDVGAFYQSNEVDFKSRDISHTGADPDGPFLIATRRRNAQRLASSQPPFNIPLAPNPGFAYDGVGNSTFRIESDFDTSGFGSGDTFIGDLGNVPPVANAQGVPFSNPTTFGELPFGWDTSVAPGTFSFLIP